MTLLRQLLFVFIAICCIQPVAAQAATEGIEIAAQRDDSFALPEFPGGKEALKQYIADNLKYPEEAQEAGIEGIVHLEFIVTKTGEVKHVRVVKGVNKHLDRAAVQLVLNMPNWMPGKKKGKPADHYYQLPVVFEI